MAIGFSQASCWIALAKMIVIDELPFMFVEQEGFRLFYSIAYPKLVIPSCITAARDVMELYKDEKEKLKSYLKNNSQRVSLTTDTWISIQQVNYIVLAAHFIEDEWKSQKRI